MKQTNQIPGLYDPSFEHDNCGIGACVNIKGVKNHQTVDNALKIVETLEHRAGKDAAGETGDGVGIMLQISHKFFSKACKAANINIGKEREYGIGMFFFPQTKEKYEAAMKTFETVLHPSTITTATTVNTTFCFLVIFCSSPNYLLFSSLTIFSSVNEKYGISSSLALPSFAFSYSI